MISGGAAPPRPRRRAGAPGSPAGSSWVAAGWLALTMAMASRLLLAVCAAALLHPAPAPPSPSRIMVIILDE